MFYLPDSIARSNPIVADLINDLHNVNLSYQGRTTRHNSSFKNIIDNMKRAMIENGFDSILPGELGADRKLKSITKEADKFERQIENLSIDVYNGVPGAKNKLVDILGKENRFYVKGEGKVFNEIINTIENVLPKLHKESLVKWINESKGLKEKLRKGTLKGGIVEYNQLRKKALDPVLSKKIKSAPMRNAIIEYIDLMNEMHTVLENGINAYIGSIKEGMKGKYTSERVDEIASLIKNKINPDNIKGYYPHYKRVLNVDFLDNLMPHLQRVSDSMSESLGKNSTNVETAIKELDGYVTGRAKGRSYTDLSKGVDASIEHSRNFFTTVKRYVDEIDRFNMISNADMNTRKALNRAKEMFREGKDLDGFGRSTVEMIQDMNRRMKGGSGFQNENIENATRSLLALEFASKLGGLTPFTPNLRSPFKNATQGLLNFVEFGPLKMMQSREFYKTRTDINRVVEDLMSEAGFLFSESMAPEMLESGTATKNFTKKIKITDRETIEFVKPSPLSNMAGKVSRFAGKTGWLMSKVENMNRKATFKFGFHEMYTHLKNSTTYHDSLIKKGLNERQIESDIIRRARNYAIRKVSLIHFDYADIAKSSWMTHPAGRLLGQFQHYSMKFLEYNKDLVLKAGDDVLAGELLGDRAQKAYMMGLVYGLVPTIATAATGLDFGNIIEHSTKDQISKLFALFTGDDEEIKKAFYGKGVLTGLPFIGAPLVSDAIALGNIYNFWNMDNDTMEKLLIGYEDYALKSGDKKVYETIRLLNVALGRNLYKTIPSIAKGNIGSALQYELGLYKTPEAKELKESVFEYKPGDPALAPQPILDALARLEEHRSSAMSKKGIYPQSARVTGKSVFKGKSLLT